MEPIGILFIALFFSAIVIGNSSVDANNARVDECEQNAVEEVDRDYATPCGQRRDFGEEMGTAVAEGAARGVGHAIAEGLIRGLVGGR